jgi:hypothetical protein
MSLFWESVQLCERFERLTGCRTSEANNRIGYRTSEINDWNGSQIFEMRHKIFLSLCGR